ncbi:carbohydrate ABC transporter permease [Marinomonas polaris]|uniref:carbohydrate ABC transporter permease n=1 Tax=Marinomonas polaris TaxID=293552 RepID=UPI003F9868F1|tara:strand:- start:6130 stop:7032 length:903 start_codon:yes stop_codon:yes gene_type:complete
MRAIFSSIRDGKGFDIILISISLIFLVLFSGVPLIYNAIMSFQEVDMFNLGTFIRPWVGLDNFKSLFEDPTTLPIFKNTAVFVIASIMGQFIIGFCLAIFFSLNFTGSKYLRGLFLVSWVMPGLVVGAVWNLILSGDFGILNYFLKQTGLITENIFWRSDIDYSLWAVVIANIWLGTAFNMILLSVGLAAIPKDIYEAAELDGATAIQRFLTITLPMMRSTIGAVISLGLIFTLQQFDLFAAITSGGPADSSNVAQYKAWEASFKEYDFARGATISVLMIVVVMIASIIYVRSTKQEVRE